jgi:hypothetical protein
VEFSCNHEGRSGIFTFFKQKKNPSSSLYKWGLYFVKKWGFEWGTAPAVHAHFLAFSLCKSLIFMLLIQSFRVFFLSYVAEFSIKVKDETTLLKSNNIFMRVYTI